MIKKSTLLLCGALLLSAIGFSQTNGEITTPGDYTLPSGTYSDLHWGQNTNVIIPEGATVNASSLSAEGSLTVNGTLNLGGDFQLSNSNSNGIIGATGSVESGRVYMGAAFIVNGSLNAGTNEIQFNGGLEVGPGANINTSGSFLSTGSLVFEENSIINVGIFSPTANGGTITLKNGCKLTSTSSVINSGSIHIDAGATLTTGDFNFSNPNNVIEGTLISNGTVNFSNLPNQINCPGKIITENLTNNSQDNPIEGSGYIEVHQSFSSLNSFTSSPGIVLNIPSSNTDQNYGAATLGTENQACNGTLPVDIISLKASQNAGSVVISWATATETNNHHYVVERSDDGVNYMEIGRQNSKSTNGNSQAVLNYSITDHNPNNGINYYRIKQVDNNGNISYFIKTVSVEINNNSISIFPNPVQTTLQIKGITSDNVSFIIYDATGRQVLKANSTKISVAGLSNGIYFVKMLNGTTSTMVGKFIKK